MPDRQNLVGLGRNRGWTPPPPYAGAVGQKLKQVHRRGKVAPIPASANALKTAVKAMFHDEDRKKNIILFGLGEEDNESLKDKVGKVLLEVNQ